MTLRAALGVACVSLFARVNAAAEPPATPGATARFALIVGVNRSVDSDAALLRYATTTPPSTRTCSAASALAPTFCRGSTPTPLASIRRPRPKRASRLEAKFLRALAQVESDVALARNRHVHTILYVVYSGHGNVDAGEAYVSLEDTRLFVKT